MARLMSGPAKASIDLARFPEGDGDELDLAVDLAPQQPGAAMAGEILSSGATVSVKCWA